MFLVSMAAPYIYDLSAIYGLVTPESCMPIPPGCPYHPGFPYMYMYLQNKRIRVTKKLTPLGKIAPSSLHVHITHLIHLLH